MATQASPTPGAVRRTLAAFPALAGTVVWTHALAGPLRAAAGIPLEGLAPAGWPLTLAALVTAAAGLLGRSPGRAAGWAALMAGAATGVLGALHPPATLPALALIPAGAACAAFGAWLSRRLPAALDREAAAHPRWTAAWVAVALLAVVQVGRLSTYMTDAGSDWFLSTRHPFYAKHECASAYVFGAELSRRGEPNVYAASHYPGLDPQAAPETDLVGMTPDDPYQYPPQFLLLPRLAIAATSDYGAIRTVWFGLNVTLCLGAVLALAFWVGGRAGTVAGLLTPALVASFPVLHDFQYGQFHFAAIALAVLGLLAFQRGRTPLGGGLLAMSILAKLFPGLLLVPLAAQRRWRELAWTAGAGAALTALAWLVLGPAPFAAFLDYQVPRLADGSAFAFGEAWPEMAALVTAGNQGVAGIVHKLGALGVPWADAAAAHTAGRVFAAVLLALAAFAGRRTRGAARARTAATWLGLLGLGSLTSTGAWADYVPLTCVWLLTFLAPLAGGRPLSRVALALCAVLQTSLVGTMPIGAASGPSWMMPLSLLGAVALLITFAAAAIGPVAAVPAALRTAVGARPPTWAPRAVAESRPGPRSPR